MPLSASLTEGRPQTNTNTVRMAQGVHARIRSAREWRVGGVVAWASPLSVSWPLSDPEVQIFFGCHTRRNRISETIETIAAMMSTSSGPMKLETRYCGMANDSPVTRIAGQISIIAL